MADRAQNEDFSKKKRGLFGRSLFSLYLCAALTGASVYINETKHHSAATEMTDFLSQYPVWLLAAFGVFAVAWLAALAVWLGVYLRPAAAARREARAARRAEASPGAEPHVSVVVYAHNQAEALLRNLPLIYEQEYPAFDVIVVDDNSCDETADVMVMMSQRYDHFHHIHIREGVRNISRRRLALMLGVKAALGSVVLMTMAQCAPTSRRWIATVAARFGGSDGADVVLAPVVYRRRLGLAARFCAYDLFQRQQALFGLTMAVGPYAGWGTNMAFRRDVFFADGSSAFCKHLKLRPGADDLFVREVARAGGKVAVACAAEALIEDQYAPVVEEWRQERKVRAFTSLYYPLRIRLVRALELATRWLVVLLGLGLAAYGTWQLVLPAAAATLAVPALQALVGAAVGMLLLYGLCVVLCGMTLSRTLGMRPLLWAPVCWGLAVTLPPLRYRLAALCHRRQFYVGYSG